MRAFCDIVPSSDNPTWGQIANSSEANNNSLLRQEIGSLGGSILRRAITAFARWASTRLQPKRRASTDHIPGPNIARAAPIVPSKRGTMWSPGSVRICHISIKATRVPAIGVHSPGIRRIPHPARKTAVIVVLMEGRSPASCPRAQPVRSRQQRAGEVKPKPGQPPSKCRI